MRGLKGFIPNKPPTVIGVRGGHRGEGGIHLPHLLFLQCNVIRQWDPTKINAQSVPSSAQLFQNCIAHICFTIVKHCAPLHALVDPGAGIWTCGMCIQEWTNSLHATSIKPPAVIKVGDAFGDTKRLGGCGQMLPHPRCLPALGLRGCPR